MLSAQEQIFKRLIDAKSIELTDTTLILIANFPIPYTKAHYSGRIEKVIENNKVYYSGSGTFTTSRTNIRCDWKETSILSCAATIGKNIVYDNNLISVYGKTYPATVDKNHIIYKVDNVLIIIDFLINLRMELVNNNCKIFINETFEQELNTDNHACPLLPVNCCSLTGVIEDLGPRYNLSFTNNIVKITCPDNPADTTDNFSVYEDNFWHWFCSKDGTFNDLRKEDQTVTHVRTFFSLFNHRVDQNLQKLIFITIR